MMKPLVVVAAMLVAPGALHSQALTPEHRAIDFLAGVWETRSVLTSGDTVPGLLEYSWVLGGEWMRVEFHGDWPGRVWEAHVMQRYDPEVGTYRSWAFFGPGDPVQYTGEVVEDGFFRISLSEDDGSESGIDYHRNDDGTVYQENWALDENAARRITLRTYYTPAD